MTKRKVGVVVVILAVVAFVMYRRRDASETAMPYDGDEDASERTITDTPLP
jgi:hypothetical protein